MIIVCGLGASKQIWPQMPEVRNGKIKRRRPAVVRGVEYEIFNY
jgi:hypothetical protein